MQIVASHAQNVPIIDAIHAVTSLESDAIRRKFGATPIYVLRQSYGAGFAPDVPGDVMLGQAITRIDSSSMALLARRLHDEGGGAPI